MFINLINNYNLITNVVMLLTAIMLLCVIWYSQPENTWLLRLCMQGFNFSILMIVVHAAILFVISNPQIYSNILFAILYIAFIGCYAFLLTTILVYISLLSYKLRLNFTKVNVCMGMLFLIFMGIMLFPLITGRLIDMSSGVPVLTRWFEIYLVCGAATMYFAAALVLIFKKTTQKAVFVGVWLFLPLEILGLSVQYFYPHIIMSAATYVMVFVTLFLLFHCAKYDETIGCQNDSNLYPYLEKLIKRNERYMVIYCVFPLLQKREFLQILESLVFTAAQACRSIESVKRNAKIYRRNRFTYITLVKPDDNEEALDIFEKLREYFEEIELDNGKVHNPVYKMIAIQNHEYLDSSRKIKSLIDFANTQFHDHNSKETLIVDDGLIEKFKTYYEVEQELLDIYVKNNLDDERVICLAQPIYKVDCDGFTTAEALMRMKFNGKMYFPDQFIPVAEDNDYIHMLTRIMINKVCKQIKVLEKSCDFNAITINCSTLEVQRDNFAEDVLSIIKLNDVNPTKIRLEITESTEINDYSSILRNMETLTAEGVQFYLDDFGTGFSNIERIVSCPFMTIKFDKSMLYKALNDVRADDLLRTLVKFFGSNGFNVLVEGVEDDANLQYAKSAGFDYIQGYHFSKPLDIARLDEFFDKK